ncbi:MAG: hypothetical protein FJ118_06545 [Deltaproteobacteria bacterium]|nr:hypothetical protein [Deltaproteobacteria bacterium]
MPDPQYRIKLYGHTSRDAKAFCKNLGLVLGVSESNARELLRQVPVALKEGLDKERGQALMEALKVISALCIIERMDRDPGTETLSELKLPFPLRIGAPEAEAPETPSILPKWARGVALGLALVTLLFLVLAAGKHFQRRDARNAAPEKVEPPITEEQAATGETSPFRIYSPENSAMVEGLKNEIDALQKENERLHELFVAERQILIGIQNQPSYPDRETLRRQKQRVNMLQQRIRTNAREISDLERDIEILVGLRE